MKRPGYREACCWIAMNDEAGAPDALDTEVVAGYISVALVADLFGVDCLRVALDVCRHRRQEVGS
jgi:hypothetical protein